MSSSKIATFVALIAASVFLLIVSFTPFAGGALKGQSVKASPGDDADLPPGFVGPPNSEFSKEEFMLQRAEGIALKRGIGKDAPFDPQARQTALRQMELQEEGVAKMQRSNIVDALLAAWTPLGPAPIPNGQFGPVSGRTIAIAVHPTNPDIVYVGTAQGGLYRTTDGGTNWTALMDNALSLAIGAIAIAPSQPDTIYVGTGEAGFCGDCFFGVGVYRIDNASTATPTISGPFNDDPTDVDIFSGRSIGEIIVHPTLPGTIFVASASGIGGIGGVVNNVLPSRGVYRSTDATSADPTFTKLTGLAANADSSIRDIAIDPLNPDLLVANLIAAGGVGGIYTSANALSATPTFTQTAVFNSASTSELTAEFAVHRVAGPNPTFYAATGNLGGRVLRSIDGGLTWVQQIDNNFCTPQCFYDIAIDVDPTNVDNVYIGGAPALVFGRSTNGGTTFTNNATTAVGLHVDSHAIAVAPSQPTTIYFGSDGGIYKSTDSGTTWVDLNNSQFSATQFMSLALHPSDRNFTIGGTQDNGTNFYQPSQLWTNTEGGDGGYTAIDQNALNTTAVTMYHTFFNQTNAMGYSRTSNAGNSWEFRGCGFVVPANNGMTCAATAILFYAPMEEGPGNPNTLYFGSDVLYRSSDGGTNMVKISQEPLPAATTAGRAISAIGISAQNDNVRLVGQRTGGIWGTVTGANPLVDLDPTNTVPNNFIGRAVIDPNNATTAYVALVAFGVTNVWKTTNLGNTGTTWASAASGLPLVPVSAFVIDPQDSNALYAGTDIGVYQSLDGGASWLPFGTGLPRVAVFGAEILNVHRILRIATHGRGLYEIPIPGTLLPVARPAGDGTSGPGGAAALVAENCGSDNGAIDPGETVTVSYTIQNVGGGPTTNLVATLQASGGVTSPSGPQSYGVIPPFGTASRDFSFTNSSNCGDTITLTFQLQDGATNFGTFNVTYVLGALVFSPASFTENFDGVTAPALPAGWTTAQALAAPLWATTASFFDSAPNSAATTGVATPGDNSLTSPTIAVPAAPGTGTNPGVELSFRNSYDTEGGFDGGVLEISINGASFIDIITAGGSFTEGGYTGILGPTDHALSGRNGWTGDSHGFITTTVRLPAAAYGQNAQLRWRSAYDTGTTSAGMRVDNVSIYAVTRICCAGPFATTITTTASGAITLGNGTVSDSATLAGGATPTGTITFNLFGPDDATCSAAPVFTSMATVAGNGTYTSGNFTPTTAGVYRWIASYSGDVNNTPVSGACNDPNESVTVNPAAPTITTTASAATTVGSSVSDSATLAGGATPTGTVTFSLFGPDDDTCSAAPVSTSTATVAGNGTYTSGNFTPTTPGVYRWIASYSGDANNTAVSGACNDANESVTVNPAAPTITTTASANGAVGSVISDSATLAGGFSPGGSIIFVVYGPDDATCGNDPVFTSTAAVTGNGTYGSGDFTPSSPGVYRWIATYSGDANNTAVSGACNDANESVTVNPATPTIATTASPNVMQGSPISDSATLAGGFNPGGSIVFAVYGPDNASCSGAPAFTSTAPVAGNGTYGSGNFTPATTGVYRWIATYSGDANNSPVSGACNDANESVTVAVPSAAQPVNLSTRMHVETGDRIGIGGFIISGSGPKEVIVRAIGPALMNAGLTGLLADPVLELHGPSGFTTITNDNWRDTQQAQIAATGIPPTNDSESAIVVTLTPGAYTALVRGKNGTTGLALVEVYDLDPSGAAQLANLSTRAFVNTGNRLVIAGFILGQNSGDDSVVARGLGPSLTALGVPGALANPALELRDSNGSLLLSNNDWQDNPAQAAAISAAGLAPTNTLEAAIFAILPPGAYTALLTGLNGGTGIGLVEIYQVGTPP